MNNQAVSPVIGVILMVAVVTVMGAATYGMMNGERNDATAIGTALTWTEDNSGLLVVHGIIEPQALTLSALVDDAPASVKGTEFLTDTLRTGSVIQLASAFPGATTIEEVTIVIDNQKIEVAQHGTSPEPASGIPFTIVNNDDHELIDYPVEFNDPSVAALSATCLDLQGTLDGQAATHVHVIDCAAGNVILRFPSIPLGTTTGQLGTGGALTDACPGGYRNNECVLQLLEDWEDGTTGWDSSPSTYGQASGSACPGQWQGMAIDDGGDQKLSLKAWTYSNCSPWGVGTYWDSGVITPITLNADMVITVEVDVLWDADNRYTGSGRTSAYGYLWNHDRTTGMGANIVNYAPSGALDVQIMEGQSGYLEFPIQQFIENSQPIPTEGITMSFRTSTDYREGSGGDDNYVWWYAGNVEIVHRATNPSISF